jgi:hypothetical protein
MSIYKSKSDVLYEDNCIKVYDPEKKELIAVYKTLAKTAGRLGVRTSCIQKKCESKKRLYSPTLKMEVAVRLNIVKDEDLHLIELSEKYQSLKPKKNEKVS